uniref:Uncharacterized protein n=1 Tax=Ceratitis capitata TaxID=7213 RepID=W8B225_CERCA
MNATKCINTTTKFPSSHSDPNFHRTELAFFVEVAATPLTFNTTITNSNNNCLSFQTTSGNGGSLANNPWQQAKISTSREYSRATAQSTTLPTTATKTAATMTLLDKEMSASDDEDTSKLMPAAIRFININNNNNNKNNSSNNNKCYGISSNNSCSSHNNRNKSNSDSHVQASSYNSDNNNSTNDISNINKSTSKSTATTTTTTTSRYGL